MPIKISPETLAILKNYPGIRRLYETERRDPSIGFCITENIRTKIPGVEKGDGQNFFFHITPPDKDTGESFFMLLIFKKDLIEILNAAKYFTEEELSVIDAVCSRNF